MEKGEVIYASKLFAERGKLIGEQATHIVGRIFDLDAYRNERDERVEAVVKQSAAGIAVILESNGYKEEGDQVLERARQFAREGIPAREIYEILDQQFKDARPDLHRVYRNRHR